VHLFNLKNTKQNRKRLRKNQTDAEKLLWSKLRNKQMHGYKMFRQYAIEKYIVDFYCPLLKLAIEVDSGQHFTEKHLTHDKEREDLIKSFGIKTLRVTNIDVLKNIEGVLKGIEHELPLPLFRKEGSINKEEF
jgi:very-short-patch-repair endonuclease